MAYENEQIGGNGSKVREHLKAAGSAAGDAARVRSGQAQEWARAQLSGIQGRLESNPQRATLWALGVGLVFGIVLSNLLRGRSE